MASAPECVARFEKERLFVASPALTARRLREAEPKYWPISGKGGGAKSPQVEPYHLTNFILAQAAHLPIDGAAAVAALRDLPMIAREVSTVSEGSLRSKATRLNFLSGQALGNVLDMHIDLCADPAMRESVQAIAGADVHLTLCADPPFALIAEDPAIGGEVVTYVFGDRLFDPNRARRLIDLPFRVITLCGELWQDSQERNAARSGAALQPESESAASLPGETAPIARPEASGTRNTAKATPRARVLSTPAGVAPCPTMTTPIDFLI